MKVRSLLSAGMAVCLAAAVAGAGDDATKASETAGETAQTALLLHFDEGQGNRAVDSSGWGHHGRTKGTVWTEGKFGKALQFNGKGGVDIGRRAGLDFGKKTDFTVECWIKVPEDVPKRFHFIVTSRLRTDMPGFTINLHKNLRVMASIGDKVHSVHTLMSKESVNDGEWRHVALTADRDGKASFYVDGVLQKSADMSQIITVTNKKRSLRVGSRGYDGDFVGCIDEVRISKGIRMRFSMDKPYEPDAPRTK